ncbi:hypothetical protein A374_08034 [Fictibacillus macauensis ZFHKF-1]|uniref:Uncharacterized protein n=1 Tax=Fictibacillus macauensis ZFHKF-1 TaxID=1196324 RepID=I8UG11_9BACL|nr:hypothetical protein [Fictibacillus macauensis]EIT85768.1 hypothetical protein A374_08034 [Fictibacillus macauensis ZFHKF-1]
MAKTSTKKKVLKKTSNDGVNKYAHTLKMVTSATCIACKTPCTRGQEYVKKMSIPGAIGKGVACHLTKGKGFV